ncbi:MAG: hypothetical protein QOE35_2063 [Actinomycetota bacterium]|jgi:uncharacterized repeat protein (TIGR03847 family)
MSEFESFDLTDVDRITVGAVGEPGRRVFLLQARAGAELVTVKVEKQQVSALAQYLADVLADLPSVGDLPGELELEEPAEPRFVVGVLGVTYDDATDRVVLVAQEAVAEESEEPDGGVLRVTATREQIAALAIRGTALVEAGRPPCPLCGFPLDPSGHVCPRTNGHRAPTL